MDLMHVAVAQRHLGLRDAVCDLDAIPPGQVLLLRHVRPGACGIAEVRDVPQRHADPQVLRPQPIHLRVAAVEQQQPLLPVEHANALPQLVQGMIAQMHLRLQLDALSPTLRMLIGAWCHPAIL